MNKINVKLKERSYTVTIENGSLESLARLLKNANIVSSITLISGEHVGPIYANKLQISLENEGFNVRYLQIPSGESNKNLKTIHFIYDSLLETNLDRSSVIIALGGGVVGDMVGFAAATLFRGIPFIQIPTTLLSQVDSSVGGKTGVNHSRGKNLIGSIYQPQSVYIYPDVLHTLPYRERVSGFVEILKYGLIRDEKFFDFLIENRQSILELTQMDAIHQAIAKSIKIKAEIVSKDEHESNLRMILNFGHTIGHAIENSSGYGTYTHGEAVLLGMCAAIKLSENIMQFNKDQAEYLIKQLQLIPVEPDIKQLDTEDIYAALKHDKKVKDAKIRFVLLRNIAETVISDAVPKDSVLNTIEWLKGLNFAKK